MSKVVGIGITGGIAAYKIADLVSRLKKEKVEVVVMMTEAATQFITPLTFKVLSGREVVTDMWSYSPEMNIKHIEIAEEIDLLVVAPATANFIAKMAAGIADDLLSTVVTVNRCPVMCVPAMNSDMYKNPILQENLKKLKNHGFKVMEPDIGRLACGDVGPGKLPEVDILFQSIMQQLYPNNDLQGKRIMVNAGTTRENIDPVRFIANRGTGKMGFAIAEEALNRGADVVLVSGATNLEPPVGVEFVSVWDAEEMCEVMLKYQPSCDIIIGAAAVGDFQIAKQADQKLKKTEEVTDKIVLELVGTPDILKEMGKCKVENQVMVGFAAETENIVENAMKKLESKNLDFIVANDVTMEGAGFATDTNIVTLITRSGKVEPLPKMSKSDVAGAILDKVAEYFQTE